MLASCVVKNRCLRFDRTVLSSKKEIGNQIEIQFFKLIPEMIGAARQSRHSICFHVYFLLDYFPVWTGTDRYKVKTWDRVLCLDIANV